MPFQLKVFRMEEGQLIRGLAAPIFIHNLEYHLDTLEVYEDGVIDCWGKVDFDEFKEKVRSGWIVLKPPEGALICAYPLGSFHATSAIYDVEPEEFIKEVADVLEGFKGRPKSTLRCQQAWAAYQEEPNEETRERLRAAYEAVPAHNRRYLLGMNERDWPIRRELGLEAPW